MDKNREPDKIDKDNTKYWYDSNGELHNDNGFPAVIHFNGSKAWYNHGQFHNDFGPAIIWSDGSKFWYKHGEFHNENGPAITPKYGSNSWYINGKEYTEQRFKHFKIKNFIDE